MADISGYWSYVHADDDADDGRISRLARDVRKEFELRTGEAIELFLDRDALQWGDEWRSKIDSTLATVAFFIPVLTPRYFKSVECRREFEFFGRRATRLGVTELVLPLLYVPVPSVVEDPPEDELVVMAKAFQYEDWTDLRLTAASSEDYRRGVARLVDRLVLANTVAENAIIPTIDVDEAELIDDQPGWLDRVQQIEDGMPELTEITGSISHEIERLGPILSESADEIRRGDAGSRPIAARLTAARKLAGRLKPAVERIYSAGMDFASKLHQVDDGFRALVERAPAEIESDPSAGAVLCGLLQSSRQLADSAHDGLGSIQELAQSIAPIEAMSRDLRPPLRRLREGLTLMLEAREVTREWVSLLEATGIECDEM